MIAVIYLRQNKDIKDFKDIVGSGMILTSFTVTPLKKYVIEFEDYETLGTWLDDRIFQNRGIESLSEYAVADVDLAGDETNLKYVLSLDTDTLYIATVAMAVFCADFVKKKMNDNSDERKADKQC